jgi:hypothetical protein
MVAACKPADGDTAYTLYRGSGTGPWRFHVATFDSAEGENYNKENCENAQSLFQQQPGAMFKYWCEKGHYRK